VSTLSIQTALNFGFPILGSEIPKLVEQFVSPDKFVLAKDTSHPDWILVGQGSEHAYEHLLIRDPINGIDGILPNATYDSLAVVTYRWPGAFRIEQDRATESLHAIEVFTEKLEHAARAYRYATAHS
jgi:hypothetical protein